MKDRIVCFGASGVVQDLERRLQQEIVFYSRRAVKGLTVIPCDVDDLKKDFDFSGQRLIYSIPPQNFGQQDVRLEKVLAAIRKPPVQIIYLSTSGVYGDCQGRWIDEHEAVKPQQERGLRRVAAENALKNYCQDRGIALTILRLAGIYGPGRLPLARLQQRLPVVCPQEAPPSNRIHSEDVALTLEKTLTKAESYRVLNVADGHPTSMTDYFYSLADRLGWPRPPCLPLREAEQQFSPMLKEFLQAPKRLRNNALLDFLERDLQYPNLDLGLQQSLSVTNS
jgi:nucleoside-diphosphate-sugar epimerase